MVSVIVPVFNSEEYIDVCITSIINQTYKDIQIVLVNDGSSDESGKICDYYAMMDDRIEVVHQNNLGQAAARKRGLLCAKGDFVLYLDSDDWIDKDYISEMIRVQKTTGADMVAGNLLYEIGRDITVVKNGIEEGCYKGKDIFNRMLCKGFFFEYGIQPHLVTKLIEKKLVVKSIDDNDLKIRIGEDAAVVYSCVLNCKKICVTDVCGYHYIQHQESMTKTHASKIDEINSINLLIKYLKERFEEAGVIDILQWQLSAYKKYLFSMRCIEVFDSNNDILSPYGEIQRSSRVVVYGAGVLGQQLFNYLTRININIIKWVDINYEEYKKRGFDVDNPDFLKEEKDFDYVLIANTNYTIAMKIKEYLLNELNIDNNKVKWFSDKFINEKI